MTATPPRADLRTLAAEPFWAVALPALSANADPRLLDLLAHALEAGVAAVLPEHRRMVLTEAVDFLDDEWPPGAHGGVLEHAADLLRVLADAAPPAGLSAPVPAENAPAVPEDTPERDRLERFAPTTASEGERPWPGLPTPGLHLVTVEDMNTCVRCGKFTGRADCPDTAPEGADERNGHG